MQKSFMIGVVLGAAAMSAYEMGNRAKNKSNVRKKRSRKNLKNFLTENNNFTSKKKNRNYFAVFCFNFVSFCYFKRSSESFSKMILSA